MGASPLQPHAVTAAELPQALKKLPLCPTEAPEEMCLTIDQVAYDKAVAFRRTSGATTPAWVQKHDLCILRQLGAGDRHPDG